MLFFVIKYIYIYFAIFCLIYVNIFYKESIQMGSEFARMS